MNYKTSFQTVNLVISGDEAELLQMSISDALDELEPKIADFSQRLKTFPDDSDDFTETLKEIELLFSSDYHRWNSLISRSKRMFSRERANRKRFQKALGRLLGGNPGENRPEKRREEVSTVIGEKRKCTDSDLDDIEDVLWKMPRMSKATAMDDLSEDSDIE
jgi:hypothetical protein